MIFHSGKRIRLAFDHGNTETVCDALEAYEILKNDIVEFHIKDFRFFDGPVPGTSLKRNGKYAFNTMIGEGDVPIAGFLDAIDNRGKTLFFDVETRDPKGVLSARDSIARGVEYLSSLTQW